MCSLPFDPTRTNAPENAPVVDSVAVRADSALPETYMTAEQLAAYKAFGQFLAMNPGLKERLLASPLGQRFAIRKPEGAAPKTSESPKPRKPRQTRKQQEEK